MNRFQPSLVGLAQQDRVAVVALGREALGVDARAAPRRPAGPPAGRACPSRSAARSRSAGSPKSGAVSKSSSSVSSSTWTTVARRLSPVSKRRSCSSGEQLDGRRAALGRRPPPAHDRLAEAAAARPAGHDGDVLARVGEEAVARRPAAGSPGRSSATRGRRAAAGRRVRFDGRSQRTRPVVQLDLRGRTCRCTRGVFAAVAVVRRTVKMKAPPSV